MSRSNDMVLAFLVGAVAGGVTALFLAPEKGSETRRKLRKRIDDLSEEGSEYLEAAVGEFRERIGIPTAAHVARSTAGVKPEGDK